MSHTALPVILQIIPELDTGGAELSTLEINRALVEAGARSIVVTEGGRMSGQIEADGGERVLLPVASKNPARILANGQTIATLIRSQGVALIHARSRAPAWSGLIAARRTGCPFMTTYHGAYGEKSGVKRFYNSVMVRGARVIANSHYTAGLIRARYGTPAGQIRVIYRGVDLKAFDPAAVSAERVADLRASWGVRPDQRVILQAGRLTGWKGQKVVIAAVERLAGTDVLGDAVVILAGDDQGREDYRRELEAMRDAAGLGAQIRLVGHCADMPAAFAAAHVAIVASIEPEAFGRAAAEAQAMRCPVISTNIGAPPETVRAVPAVDVAARTGWLVGPADPSALAEALNEALSMSPQDREALGQRAREHVTSAFSLDRMKFQTLAVYDEILGSSLAEHWTRSAGSNGTDAAA